MALLRDAWKDLQDNTRIVFGYIACVMLMNGATHLAHYGLGAALPEETPPWAGTLVLVIQIVNVCGHSAIMAIIFSALAAAVDRPLWKYEGVADALRRFALPWFLIHMTYLVIQQTQMRGAEGGDENLVLLTDMFRMIWLTIAPILGACIMFWGRLDWPHLGESLAPIVRRIELMLIPALLNVGIYLLFLVAAGTALNHDQFTSLIMVVADAPLALLECLSFAMVIRVCVVHRERADTEDDDNFDF